MKNATKITLIIMAVIMLVSACATNETPTFAGEEATNTPAPVLAKAEPTPEPAPEPMPETPAEIAAWVAKTYDYVAPVKASYYALCSMPFVSDFAYIAEGFPKEIYMYPYNTKTSSQGNFTLPKDVPADIAAEAVNAVNLAVVYGYSRNYEDLTAWRNAADILLPDTKEWREYRAGAEQYYTENHVVSYAHAATDPSLVYIDDAGDVRIRAIVFVKTVRDDGPEEYREKGIWFSQMFEYILAKNENGYFAFDEIQIEDSEWTLDEVHEALFEQKGFGDFYA